MAFQITGVLIVYSTVYSGANQRKHHSSASLAFVRGIHRWSVDSPHKGPVTRKMFPFDDVIMDTTLCFNMHRYIIRLYPINHVCLSFLIYLKWFIAIYIYIYVCKWNDLSPSTYIFVCKWNIGLISCYGSNLMSNVQCLEVSFARLFAQCGLNNNKMVQVIVWRNSCVKPSFEPR